MDLVPLSVVNCIPKAWCVHDGELEFDALLLDVHCVLCDFHSLGDPLWKENNLIVSLIRLMQNVNLQMNVGSISENNSLQFLLMV